MTGDGAASRLEAWKRSRSTSSSRSTTRSATSSEACAGCTRTSIRDSRFPPRSRSSTTRRPTRRGRKRGLISRASNFLLHLGLGARFSDAQCGFKAITAVAARRLLPAVQDQAWFFDTELLVLAQRAGMRIHEVPVDWTDDPDSRVDIAKTAIDDLRGILRLRFGALTMALSRQVL